MGNFKCVVCGHNQAGLKRGRLTTTTACSCVARWSFKCAQCFFKPHDFGRRDRTTWKAMCGSRSTKSLATCWRNAWSRHGEYGLVIGIGIMIYNSAGVHVCLDVRSSDDGEWQLDLAAEPRGGLFLSSTGGHWWCTTVDALVTVAPSHKKRARVERSEVRLCWQVRRRRHTTSSAKVFQMNKIKWLLLVVVTTTTFSSNNYHQIRYAAATSTGGGRSPCVFEWDLLLFHWLELWLNLKNLQHATTGFHNLHIGTIRN